LKLYEKETGKCIETYGTGSDSNGFPKFLIRENGQWIWRSAKHYITYEEADIKFGLRQKEYERLSEEVRRQIKTLSNL
jgi:hypothetical protein